MTVGLLAISKLARSRFSRISGLSSSRPDRPSNAVFRGACGFRAAWSIAATYATPVRLPRVVLSPVARRVSFMRRSLISIVVRMIYGDIARGVPQNSVEVRAESSRTTAVLPGHVGDDAKARQAWRVPPTIRAVNRRVRRGWGRYRSGDGSTT